MTIAIISLIALVIVVLIGVVRNDINIGVLAITSAYIVGIYAAGMTPATIAAGFPVDMFLMLVGVTLLFGMAQNNGTLDVVSRHIIRLARGNPKLLPLLFYFAALLLSALGPGNTPTVALLAPIGMSIAAAAEVSFLLMAVLIITGANAGAVSPISLAGVVNAGLMEKIGLDPKSLSLTLFFMVMVIQTIIALGAYVFFKGYKAHASEKLSRYLAEQKASKLNREQTATIVIFLLLIISVVFLQVPIGAGAFIAASIFSLFKLGDEERSIKLIPWGTILLISGVTVLISIIEKTGGLDLATQAIAAFATPQTINPLLAFLAGIVSSVSSSTGVTLPMFILLVPKLVEQLGGGNMISMIVAINVGAYGVDVSPLSALGALCLAALPVASEKPRLFRQLLLWGLSMAVVGAVLSWAVLDVLLPIFW